MVKIVNFLLFTFYLPKKKNWKKKVQFDTLWLIEDTR